MIEKQLEVVKDEKEQKHLEIKALDYRISNIEKNIESEIMMIKEKNKAI